MAVSIVPQQSPIAPPSPRPIPGHNRLTGELVALVPSGTQPGLFHITTPTSCSCKGYSFRKSCRHPQPQRNDLRDGGAAHLAVQRAAGSWPAVSAETKAKADLARQIWGTDDD